MVFVPEPTSKKWLFCLSVVLGNDQAYQTFFKKTLKWKDVGPLTDIFSAFTTSGALAIRRNSLYWILRLGCL